MKKGTMVFMLILVSLLVPMYAVCGTGLLVSFDYQGKDPSLVGFRLYLGDSQIMEVADPHIREITYTGAISYGSSLFTMTAYGPNWESGKSPVYPYEFHDITSPIINSITVIPQVSYPAAK